MSITPIRMLFFNGLLINLMAQVAKHILRNRISLVALNALGIAFLLIMPIAALADTVPYVQATPATYVPPYSVYPDFPVAPANTIYDEYTILVADYKAFYGTITASCGFPITIYTPPLSDGAVALVLYTSPCGGGNQIFATVIPPIPAHCPDGYAPNVPAPNTTECTRPDPIAKNAGCDNPASMCGDPINAATGNDYEETTDYNGAGTYPLTFSRSYNSLYPSATGRLGAQWNANSEPDSLSFLCAATYSYTVGGQTYLICDYWEAVLTRSDGSQLDFYLPYSVFNNFAQYIWSGFSSANPSPFFSNVLDPDGNLVDVSAGNSLQITSQGYIFQDSAGRLESFDTNGKLISVTVPGGLSHSYYYDANGRVTSISDNFGRTLSFTYDSNDRIQTMINPAGGVTTYSYDANNNLIKVIFPDNSSVQYQYTNTTYKNALTGVVDENGNQYVTYTYDSQGRAISSVQGSNASPFNIVYNSDGSADVTEPTDEVRHLTFQTLYGTSKFSSASAPCTLCGDKTQSLSYNGNGYVNSATDFNGNITQYTHDTAGRLLTETDAYGTAVARTISTQWDTTRNLPDLITEPGRTTTYTRNNPISPGQPFTWTTTVTDTATQISRTTTYNYNGAALLSSIVGPRTDVSQTTSITYDNHGDIATITNALGQVTQITSYDGNGYPLTIIDPNGVTTTLTYDARQRLTSRTVAGATTLFKYDPAGNLIRVTLPPGAYLQYSYDTAHRLYRINDNYGNAITYTLDNLGNRIAENTTDPHKVLTRTLQRTFDSLNHLLTVTGGASQVTHYTEDLNGNTTGITDPLSHAYTQGFDALNRLASVLDPYNKTTGYTYDALDRVTAVSDPRTLNTQYSYDGFDDLTQLISSDTGRTAYSYDLDGDRLTKTDARSITTQYTYDALDRLTAIHYPTSTLNMTFAYDQGTDGIGHLTGIQDASGVTAYTYNARGDITQKTDAIGSIRPHNFTVSYGYDTDDNLTSITYPDGSVVSYTRDSDERITSVTRGTSTFVSGVTYKPFGPVSGLTYGNGLAETRSYDQDYRLTSLTDPNILSWTLGYNADDAITSLTDNLVGSNSQTLGYDNLNRLNTGTGAYGSLSYGYDANGNRNTETLNGTNTTFNIASSSNQLVSLSGGININYSYDADGSLTGDGTYIYAYDNSERLASVTKTGTTASYIYNALGQRVEKTVNGASTVFIYDESGHLIGEYTPSGGLIAEHILLGDQPIGVITPAGLYYVQTDQLGTPRVITNSSKHVVWRWSSDPFGTTQPTGSITYNPRFPGQYFDAETGHNYNYFRDYDASIGRYIESDPIGLRGGLNSYVYVGNNTLIRTDKAGLAWSCSCQSSSDGGVYNAQGTAKICTYLCSCKCTSANSFFKIVSESTERGSNPFDVGSLICHGQNGVQSPNGQGEIFPQFDVFTVDSSNPQAYKDVYDVLKGKMHCCN